MAAALASLHSIKLNKYGKPLTERKEGTRLDYLHDGIETLRTLAQSFTDYEDITALIDQSLDKMENRVREMSEVFMNNDFTLIHFDLNKSNILYSKDSGDITIIDWEQAAAGDSAMDIAKLFFKSNFDSDQRQKFLEQYESQIITKDPHLQERLQVYEQFVLANSILWRLGVLKNMPSQTTNDKEEQFYGNVRTNLAKELETLKKTLPQ